MMTTNLKLANKKMQHVESNYKLIQDNLHAPDKLRNTPMKTGEEGKTAE